jgi:hypothetical protein
MSTKEKIECQCKIVSGFEDRFGENETIEQCPLCKAAPEMLAALKDMFKATDEIAAEFIQNKRAANWKIINDAYVRAELAIAKAESKGGDT